VTFGRRVETIAQRVRRAQDPLREEGGIDERLAIARESEDVRRRRIDRACDCALRERRVLTTKPCLGAVIGTQLDPRRDARHQSAERFEVSHGAAIGSGRLLHRHSRVQRAVREVGEHWIGEASEDVDPQRAIALRALIGRRLLAARQRAGRDDGSKELPAVHVIE
jgi:hypothetical protein